MRVDREIVYQKLIKLREKGFYHRRKPDGPLLFHYRDFINWHGEALPNLMKLDYDKLDSLKEQYEIPSRILAEPIRINILRSIFSARTAVSESDIDVNMYTQMFSNILKFIVKPDG